MDIVDFAKSHCSEFSSFQLLHLRVPLTAVFSPAAAAADNNNSNNSNSNFICPLLIAKVAQGWKLKAESSLFNK